MLTAAGQGVVDRYTQFRKDGDYVGQAGTLAGLLDMIVKPPNAGTCEAAVEIARAVLEIRHEVNHAPA